MNELTSTDVLAYADRCAGRIRLSRPKALNALTFGMVEGITNALLEWRDEDDVRIVLIDHTGGRGFCAGGDVLAIASGLPETGLNGHRFFFAEYRLNHLMYTYPKPGVVFMDGVVMGGGVGIACPCRYRVATERTIFAMPETTIGLFPDVGGGRYLSRLRGRIAQYLALTSARLTGSDCMALGITSHFIPSERLDEVKAEICLAPEKTESILAGAVSAPPPAPVLEHLPAIDRLFASDTLEEILAALEADGGEWALAQRGTILTRSPTACKVSLRMLVESPRHLHFVDEMRMEFGIMVRLYRGPDFQEGVRALLLERTNDPRWSPPYAEQVTDTMVDSFFAPLASEEAWSPLSPFSRR